MKVNQDTRLENIVIGYLLMVIGDHISIGLLKSDL